MDREQIIAGLRAHEQELKSAGIMSLSVFGSVARGDATAQSDVDLMAECDSSKKFPCSIWSVWKTVCPIFLACRLIWRPQNPSRMASANALQASPRLPFRDPSRPLRDIADAIAMIEDFTGDMDFESFRANPMAVTAVERKLQVISEAAGRPGADAEKLYSGLPWRNIRGLGNWLRHQYDRIELTTIWTTVKLTGLAR